MTRRRAVAVLGATGAVGQTFVRLLAGHPWFELTAVAASDRSAGRKYADVTHWLEGRLPANVGEMDVLNCDPDDIAASVVFSALDSSVAGEIEESFARAGKLVLSNARNHRMDDDVPLVIPEVNGEQLAMLEVQRRKRGWSGGIVTNPNCAATVAAIAMAPLHARFGIESAVVMTMQAVSGAGYPGVPSLDIVGNVVPFIADEEDKIERELRKLLGTLDDGTVKLAPFAVSAHANRVPVEHGHTTCLTLGFRDKPTVADALQALREWVGYERAVALPTAPPRALLVSDSPDRPQPRRDVNLDGGMTVTVGRVRGDSVLDLRLVAMGHNTVRGAAGGSILNAELLAVTGAIPDS